MSPPSVPPWQHIIMALFVTICRTSHFLREPVCILTTGIPRLCAILAITVAWLMPPAGGRLSAEDYQTDIQPILEQYCYDCHAYGAAEGNFTLDAFESPAEALAATDLWWRVVKNLRAGVMPPLGEDKPNEEELQKIYQWIKFGPFQIDPENVDPGPVSVSRLNREQYGNTVRELMGVPFDEKLLFSPDDSGHGFDNVADALMVSPLLLDKYLQAAEQLVARAVPQVTWIVPKQELSGSEFRSTDSEDSRQNGRRLDGKEAASVQGTISVAEPGMYDLRIVVKQHGSFEFDPARYTVMCAIDGKKRFSKEMGWDEHKATEFLYQEDWQAGRHQITFQLQPVEPESVESEPTLERKQDTSVSFEIDTVTIQGPLGTDRRVHPENYQRFFPRETPPEEPQERREYAEEVLKQFAARAFRGRAPQDTVERLVRIAEANYLRPKVTFEAGVGRAIVAALVSPKFLFRIETTLPTEPDAPYALIDELSLASRLSYFLWSSMPDAELFELAEAGQLREQLSAQVDRLLKAPQAKAFIANFVGQWLRTRDVQNSTVDAEVVLGFSDELAELREWLASRPRSRGRDRSEMSDEDQAKFARFGEIRQKLERVDDDLKRAMQQETELLVDHVVRQDASLLDLLDCDYTFVNQKLAEHYGIPGVEGQEMRLIQLPSDSPRGGLLTHASMLMVTSNPTRTSPVKRGLFVLENILGTPAPPAPGVVPELEESANQFQDHQPSLRQLLEVHRENDLCASCHARMDPIGLALENFDALGMWRTSDGDAAIDPRGQLVTGATFADVRSLKKLLREQHAHDFYRCVTEKLLVFAIGRGIEYSDEHTVDSIVQQLDKSGGNFRSLVHAVVGSAPFQKQRVAAVSPSEETDH